jgi:hypothetical protein
MVLVHLMQWKSFQLSFAWMVRDKELPFGRCHMQHQWLYVLVLDEHLRVSMAFHHWRTESNHGLFARLLLKLVDYVQIAANGRLDRDCVNRFKDLKINLI